MRAACCSQRVCCAWHGGSGRASPWSDRKPPTCISCTQACGACVDPILHWYLSVEAVAQAAQCTQLHEMQRISAGSAMPPRCTQTQHESSRTSQCCSSLLTNTWCPLRHCTVLNGSTACSFVSQMPMHIPLCPPGTCVKAVPHAEGWEHLTGKNAVTLSVSIATQCPPGSCSGLLPGPNSAGSPQ